MKLSRDGSAGTLHPRENLKISGTLGSVNAEIVVDCDGASSFSLDLRGTFNMTVVVEFTTNGTDWLPIPVKLLTTGTYGPYLSSIVGTAQGVWVGPCGPFGKIRARVSAWTSGSATATLIGTMAVLPVDAFDATTLIGTTTGASGAAVTLTLASPGAGLRHYLTYLRISRIATAALTAAATPVIVTTTNLPGSLAFSIQADAALQGTIFAIQEDFAYPIAASAQNTATTIVCPVTTGVIWRITAGYQVRP
jgi:hypothetical protein